MRNKHRKSKWKKREISLFLEKMALFIDAGLSVDNALKICRDGEVTKKRRTIQYILDMVTSGCSFALSFSDSVYTGAVLEMIIANGESTGQLSKSLVQARIMLEKEDELIKKCISAMVYPILIGIFSLLLTIGLVKGVMPQIIPMLKSLNVELPLITQAVIYVSEGLLDSGYIALIASIILLVIFKYSLKRFENVRYYFQTLLLLIPILGNLIRHYYLSIFLSSVGSLISSGKSTSESFIISAKSISLVPLKRYLLPRYVQLNNGKPLSSIFYSRNIPIFIAPLICAGEMSGVLSGSLERASLILENDLDHMLRRLTSMIEPLLMCLMGSIVGTIALAIMMPIYDISKSINT